jgi:hypothetical protein
MVLPSTILSSSLNLFTVWILPNEPSTPICIVFVGLHLHILGCFSPDHDVSWFIWAVVGSAAQIALLFPLEPYLLL